MSEMNSAVTLDPPRRARRSRTEDKASEKILGLCQQDLFAIVSIVMLTVCYFQIEHSWEQSTIYGSIDDAIYTGSENETADRLSQVNQNSTLGRLALCGLGIFGWIYKRPFRFRVGSSLGIAGACLAGVLVASLFWSILPNHTFFKLTVLATLTIAASGIAAQLDLNRFLQVIAVSAACFVLLGLLAEIQQGNFRLRGDYRFIGTTHPNTEAIFGGLLCLISQLYLDKESRLKLLGWMFLALGAFVIILTKSRTTLGAVLVSLMLIRIFAIPAKDRPLLLAGGIFLIGLLGLGSLVLSAQATSQLGNVAAMGRGDDVTTLTGRTPLWEELLTWINKSPLVGYGYLAFWDAKRVEYLSSTFRWEIPHGHNMYLDVLLDVGLLGLVLFILWLVTFMATAVYYRERTGRVEYAIVLGILVCAVINGFGESLFKLPGFPLFVLVGCFFQLIKVNDGLTKPEKGEDDVRGRRAGSRRTRREDSDMNSDRRSRRFHRRPLGGSTEEPSL